MLSSSSQTPKTSIIAIAYNLEKYIEKCIHSLINQTLREIEIIVVDDGSTDSTLTKINAIAEQDKRVKVINQINQGSNTARENGFKIATGKYVQFVDGDDWLDLESCETLYNQAEKEQADVVVFHYQKVYSNGKKQKCWGYRNKRLDSHPFISFVKGGLFCSLCIKLLRRQFLVDCDFQFPKNITYGEDEAFSFIFFLHNPNMAYINQALYHYRKYPGSLTNNLNGYIEDCEKVFVATNKALDASNVAKKIRAYGDLYFVKYLNALHFGALKTNNPMGAQCVAQKLLDRQITLYNHISYETLLHNLVYRIYNHQPKILFWINRLRILLRHY